MNFEKKPHHQYINITEIPEDIKGQLAKQFPIEADVVFDVTLLENPSTLLEYMLPVILTQQKNGWAFVWVYEDVAVFDDCEVDILVVPTYNEALDVLELERISRDLGF